MLTDKEVKSAQAKEKTYTISDSNGGTKGLLLSITPSGTKSWVLRVYVNGKEHRRGIGSYPEISLKRARDICAEIKNRPYGIGRDNLLFQDIYKEWRDGLISRKLSASYLRNLDYRAKNYILPTFGHLKLNQITPRMILSACRDIEAKGYYEVAKRVKIAISQVFDHAIDMDDIVHNPAERVGKALTHKQETHLATTTGVDNIGYLITTIEKYRGSKIVKLCLLLLAYTFVRPSEARNAQWSEFQDGIWIIPASRMKMKREHRIPLSAQAIEILKELQELSGHTKYLFPSSRSNKRSISVDALRQALRRMNIQKEDMTPHGFRAMASTVLNENGFPPDAIEIQLAHLNKDRVRSAYNRAEYMEIRKNMLQWYADYIDFCCGKKVIPPKPRLSLNLIPYA